MKIGLCVIGGPTIGTGHLYRCIALADWFNIAETVADISFELIDADPDGPDAAREIIAARSPHTINIHSPEMSPDDMWGGVAWDALVVDCLRVAPNRMRAFKARTRCLVSIDDTGEGRYVADIAANPLYACEYPAPPCSNTLSLVELDSQIIAPAFCGRRAPFRKNARNVLLMQGGADSRGLLSRLTRDLSMLLDRCPELTLHVVSGAAALNGGAGDGFEDSNSRNRIKHHAAIEDMPSFLSNIDLAVSAAGIAPFELAALGVPLVLVTGEKKEIETAERIAATGAAVSLGLYNDETGPELARRVEDLIRNPAARQAMRDAAKTHISGRGGDTMTRYIRRVLQQTAAGASR